MAEIFVCILMGLLAGKTKLRVPSVSTMSRMLSAVDEDMVSLAIMNWIGEISNTRGIHIAIDGKGLRAAANKVRDERTPYILNALDVTTKLVIGQLAIHEKSLK